MNPKSRMTKEEIHDFGIEIIRGQLQKDGFEIITWNSDLASNPQIVAKKSGRLCFIVVRTACYPDKGQLEDGITASLFVHARKHDADIFFASVGIANASGKTEEELSDPVRGTGFHISYAGLQQIVDAANIRLIDSNEYEEFEQQIAIVFASCWNRLDFSWFGNYLADDVVCESQNVMEPLCGRLTVFTHLCRKSEAVRKEGPSHRVYAELGTMERIYAGRPCVLLSQGVREDKLILVLFKTFRGKVKRIDLCTVAPLPSDARGTGEYPE